MQKEAKARMRELYQGILGGRKFHYQIKLAIRKGIDIWSEPMIRNVVYANQLAGYQSIKKKARILMQESCTLIGVVDETGLLEPNEIFVQIRRDNFADRGGSSPDSEQFLEHEIVHDDSVPRVLTGELLVTRNPCLNPGDLRLLRGVDRPELRHLSNVVVFSSKGERPTCNMMSGGDLDGDVYFVCWDQELIGSLSVDQMVDPGHYTKPTTLKEKPPSEGLPDYFVFYLERDVLGKLANLHLALCDQYGRDGPKHPDCLALAHLQSIAVDFAKHGECVPPAAFKPMQEAFTYWPDFFEKDNQESRLSDGVLGVLYRDISNEGPMEAFIRQDYQTAIKFEYELDKRIVAQAQNPALMHSYLSGVNSSIVQPMIKKLKQLMMEFNFASEAEIFASDLRFKMFDSTSDNRYSCNIPLKNEESMNRIKGKLDRLIQRFKSKFNDLAETHRQGQGERGIKDADSEVNLAVAVYLATYLDVNDSTKAYFDAHQQDKRFYDFFVDELLENNQVPEKFQEKMKLNYELYKATCTRIANGDNRKQTKMLQIRKFLSMPWLICPDALILNLK